MPLETGTASVFDTEPGYRIAHREYALPDIHLEPDEAAAVGIAARLWQHAGLAAAASSGLAKLRAAGIDVDPHATLGVEPVVTVDPAFAPLTAAARDRRAVTFDYRTPEDDAAGHPPAAAVGRGLLARPVVRGRPRPRTATPPAASGCPASSARCAPPAAPGAFTPPRRRRPDQPRGALVRAGRAHRPGHRPGPARAGRPGCAAGRRRPCPGPTATGWSLRVRRRRVAAPASWSATAPTCAVLDPPEVREAVIQRLKEVAARHDARAPRGAVP